MVGDLNGSRFRYFNDNTNNIEFSKMAITALRQYEDIYDYYLNVLNRKSYDNKGSKIILNLEVRESTFGKEQLQNAAWSGITNQIYIGYWNGTSFSISKDVLGHEFTHGVVNHTTNFFKGAKA